MTKVNQPALSNCAWWHEAPSKDDPLEAVRITADCLERGLAVPSPASVLVAAALRKYLAGQTDITGNLGLRTRRGVRHAAAREGLADRDSTIRAIFKQLPGKKTARAKKLSGWLIEPPQVGVVTEADIFQHLMKLHVDHAGNLPKSFERILGIVRDET